MCVDLNASVEPEASGVLQKAKVEFDMTSEMEQGKGILVVEDAKVSQKKKSAPKKSGKKGGLQRKKDLVAYYEKPVRFSYDLTSRPAETRCKALPLTVEIEDETYDSDVSLDFDSASIYSVVKSGTEEHVYFLKALYEEIQKRRESRSTRLFESRIRSAQGLRRHITGCARTEGHYNISSGEKKLHLRQVAAKTRDLTSPPTRSLLLSAITDDMQTVTSRASRIAQRQQSFALDTQKKAIPIDSADSLKFNQLKARKKRLKFAKSEIHDWGLFAMEHIEAGEMIIEYIGEKIRQKVADLRELAYEKQGIGSSYLFRLDDDMIIDATKTGNLARFINHSCEVGFITSGLPL